MCHFRGLYKPLKTTSSKNYVLHHSVCYRYLLCYVGDQHAPKETSPPGTYCAMFEASTPPRRHPHSPHFFRRSELMSVLSFIIALQVCRASVVWRVWSSDSAHHLYAPL